MFQTFDEVFTHFLFYILLDNVYFLNINVFYLTRIEEHLIFCIQYISVYKT